MCQDVHVLYLNFGVCLLAKCVGVFLVEKNISFISDSYQDLDSSDPKWHAQFVFVFRFSTSSRKKNNKQHLPRIFWNPKRDMSKMVIDFFCCCDVMDCFGEFLFPFKSSIVFVSQKPLFYVWVSLWWTMSWQVEQLICWLNGSERNSPTVSSSFIHKWDLAYKEGKRTRKRPPENEGNNLWNMMLGNTMFLLKWSPFFWDIYVTCQFSGCNYHFRDIFYNCLSWDPCNSASFFDSEIL